MFKLLGLLCYGFAIVDLGTYYFGIMDITGLSWSPIAAGVLGSVLMNIGGEAEEAA